MKRPGVASAGGIGRVRRLRRCNARWKCGCSRRWRRLYCLDCLSGPGLVSGSEVDNDLSSTQLAARETDEARSREPHLGDPYEPPSPSKRTVLSLAASHSSNRQGQDFVSNAVHICKTQECHARKVSHLASSCEGFSVAFTLEYTGEIPFCKTERSFPSVTCMSIGHVASLMGLGHAVLRASSSCPRHPAPWKFDHDRCNSQSAVISLPGQESVPSAIHVHKTRSVTPVG